MANKLSIDEIRFICILLLPICHSKELAAAEIAQFADKAKFLMPHEKECVASRSDWRIVNRLNNVVSHRRSPKNPIRRGLVIWNEQKSTYAITPKGRDFLARVATIVGPASVLMHTAIGTWLRSFASAPQNEKGGSSEPPSICRAQFEIKASPSAPARS